MWDANFHERLFLDFVAKFQIKIESNLTSMRFYNVEAVLFGPLFATFHNTSANSHTLEVWMDTHLSQFATTIFKGFHHSDSDDLTSVRNRNNCLVFFL